MVIEMNMEVMDLEKEIMRAVLFLDFGT